MRDEFDYLLHVIEREGGWRAFALNLLTMFAICGVLYALCVVGWGMAS